LSLLHPWSGVQFNPLEGVHVSGEDPSKSAAVAAADNANPIAKND